MIKSKTRSTYIEETLVSGLSGFTGSNSNDRIDGDDTNNTLYGLGGDDTIYGYAGDDFIAGGDGNDYLGGGSGNDQIWGEAGNDQIVGGLGDDILSGGAGNDIIDGGIGNDTLTYADSISAVTVSLVSVTSSGGGGSDSFVNIENVQGSLYNDILTGNDADNWLWGLDGNDRLTGGAGNDRLLGGLGNDILDGGNGIDTIGYSEAAGANGAIVVDLEKGTATGGGGVDILIGIENIRGSIYGDILIGDANNNDIYGREGDDLITGGYGEDILDGGDGVDTVNFDIAIGTGTLRNLRIDLTDTSLNGSPRLYEVDNSNNVTFASSETFVNFENVIGWKANDFITGDGNNNRLDGRNGNDTLTGNGGSDTFIFSNGNDRVTDFQNGADYIEISSIFGATNYNQLNVAQSGANTVITLGTNSLTLNNFLSSNLDSSDFFFVA